jgi:translation initiation factor IF-1
MAREDAFKVEGIIVEVLGNRTCRVELANGHRLLGFVPGKTRAKTTFAGLKLGEKILVEISPYDLSEGRILVERFK